jgi:hypothetical protein
MEVAIDQVVGVIAMRNRGVAAAGAVYVTGRVAVTCVGRRATGRVGRVDRDRAFVDMIAVHHVQMPVVEVVDVAAVLDREMPAVGTVDMAMIGVREMRRHGSSFRRTEGDWPVNE